MTDQLKDQIKLSLWKWDGSDVGIIDERLIVSTGNQLGHQIWKMKQDDIEINVAKEKKQTNVRASSSDIAVILTPPTILSLEQCIDFLEDDELLEVTPKNLRLRKKILNSSLRSKSKKQ